MPLLNVDRFGGLPAVSVTGPSLTTIGMKLRSLAGTEEMSRLFNFRLEMDYLASESLPADNVIGQTARFHIAASSQGDRYFDGIVNRFGLGPIVTENSLQRQTCWAEVVPKLWLLKRTADCRIFEHKTIPQIVESVLEENGFTVGAGDDADCTLFVADTYPERIYTVQYRESDFNFISRLLEDEGIYYYFEHSSNGHKLIIADAYTHYAPRSSTATVATLDYKSNPANHVPDATIMHWERQFQFRTGHWAHTDYDFRDPGRLNMLRTSPEPLGDQPLNSHEIFEFPGGFDVTDQGARLADLRRHEEEQPGDIALVTSLYSPLYPGLTFKFHGQDGAGSAETFVTTWVAHRAVEKNGAGENEYQNTFTCIPTQRERTVITDAGDPDAEPPVDPTTSTETQNVTFRPARVTRRPIVQGPQTAVVVKQDGGTQGEETRGGGYVLAGESSKTGRPAEAAATIDSDAGDYARVKVRFHWSRAARPRTASTGDDLQLSCWLRVSDNWAGKGYGVLFHPRPGQEVVVDFLEGDPDRPLITGRVYNHDQPAPGKIKLAKDAPFWSIGDAIAEDWQSNGFPLWFGKGDYSWAYTNDDQYGRIVLDGDNKVERYDGAGTEIEQGQDPSKISGRYGVSNSQSVIRSASLDGGIHVHTAPTMDPFIKNRGIIVYIEERTLPGIWKVFPVFPNPFDLLDMLGGPADGGWFNLLMDHGNYFHGIQGMVRKYDGSQQLESLLKIFLSVLPPGMRPSDLWAQRFFLPKERWALEHFNEIRFEDAKDKEFIYIHAEKDFVVDVEHDYQLRTARNRSVLIDRRDSLTVAGPQALTLKGGQAVTVFGDQGVSVTGNREVKIQRLGPPDLSESLPGSFELAGWVSTALGPYAGFMKLGQRFPALLPGLLPEKTVGELYGNLATDVQNDNNLTVGRDDFEIVGRRRITVIGSANLTKAEAKEYAKLPAVPSGWTKFTEGLDEYKVMVKPGSHNVDLTYGFKDIIPGGNTKGVGNDRQLIAANRIVHVQGNDLLEVGFKEAKLLALPERLGTESGNRRILVHKTEEHQVGEKYKVLIGNENSFAKNASGEMVGEYSIIVRKAFDLKVANDANVDTTATFEADTITVQAKDSKGPGDSKIEIKKDGSISITSSKSISIVSKEIEIGDGTTSKVTLNAKDIALNGKMSTKLSGNTPTGAIIQGNTIELKSDLIVNAKGSLLKFN
jgi:type VI secretion system VgrG family protein